MHPAKRCGHRYENFQDFPVGGCVVVTAAISDMCSDLLSASGTMPHVQRECSPRAATARRGSDSAVALA